MKGRRAKKQVKLIEPSNFIHLGDIYYIKIKQNHVFLGMAHVRHKFAKSHHEHRKKINIKTTNQILF